MAKLCPICKKNKMTLGGMALKDGAFCSSCYDRILEKASHTIKFDALMTNDLIELVNRETDNYDYATEAEKLLKQRQEASERLSPLLDSFKESYQTFFATAGIEENAQLQSTATQLLWHRLLLQKQRLNSKGLSLASECKRAYIDYVYPVYATELFDGKYELAIVRESIAGCNKFYKSDKLLYSQKELSAARYRILSAHQIGKHDIVCPACGNVSTRSNLIDGCDYCGTKFTIEDLSSRVSEYRLEKDLAIEASKYFGNENEFTVFQTSAILIFALSACAVIVGAFMGLFSPLELLLMIPGCAILAGLLGLVIFFFYVFFVKMYFWLARSNEAVDQISDRQSKEQARRGAILEEIKQHDPLFSAEGFYSELENMLAAIHYADKAQEISAFWEQPQQEKLQALLNSYKDAINLEMAAIAITDYFLQDQLQHIKVSLTATVLKENNSKAQAVQEQLELELVKSINCKTEAVCAPALLRCKNCGASLSLMEGCHCHYCGHDSRLADIAWAIKSINLKK